MTKDLGVPASSGGRACALRVEPAAQSQAEPLVPNAAVAVCSGMSATDPSRIASVGVFKTYESCERHTFYVRLTNGEGFTIEPMSYATGSVYTNHEGLSIDEARDRALIDAADWADFFGLHPEPYLENGERFEPLMTFDRYAARRGQREGCHAIATETRRAETTKIGSVEDEGAGPKDIAQ